MVEWSRTSEGNCFIAFQAWRQPASTVFSVLALCSFRDTADIRPCQDKRKESQQLQSSGKNHNGRKRCPELGSLLLLIPKQYTFKCLLQYTFKCLLQDTFKCLLQDTSSMATQGASLHGPMTLHMALAAASEGSIRHHTHYASGC
jgi:hypothetical protein